MEARSMTPKKKDREQPGQVSLLGTASTMGLHMVSGPVVGAGLGWLVDKWLGSWPVGASVGLLFGLAAGFRNVWIDARYLARSNAARDEAEKARREEEAARQEKARPAAVRDRVVPVPDSPASLAAEEEGAQRQDAFTASILAGTDVPSEKDLDELDETLEAIRRALGKEGAENGKKDEHEHN